MQVLLCLSRSGKEVRKENSLTNCLERRVADVPIRPESSHLNSPIMQEVGNQQPIALLQKHGRTPFDAEMDGKQIRNMPCRAKMWGPMEVSAG